MAGPAGGEEEEVASDTERSSAEETQADDETRVLKMLYKGYMAEVYWSEEQERKAKAFNRIYDRLGISNTDFIRTSEPRHHNFAQEIYQKV